MCQILKICRETVTYFHLSELLTYSWHGVWGVNVSERSWRFQTVFILCIVGEFELKIVFDLPVYEKKLKTHLIRLKRYFIPFGASHPISACFLPFATSHTKARRSLLMVTMRAPSGLKSRSSISFSCALISCVRDISGKVQRRRKPSLPPVASIWFEGLIRTHFW